MRTMVRKDEILDGFQELTVFLGGHWKAIGKQNQSEAHPDVSMEAVAKGIGHRLCWKIEVDKWGWEVVSKVDSHTT